MAENRIKDENYYTIHGWMINRLGLKGIQLSLYAIIYGFSQGGENEYRGRLQYLCEFTGGTSKPTVIKALKELVDKGYLAKREEVINGVLFVRYRAVQLSEMKGGKEILPGVKKFNHDGKETLPGGGKEILPPTLHNNNLDSDIEGGNIYIPPSPETIIDLYNSTCPSLQPVQYTTDERKQAISTIMSKYTVEKLRQCFQIAENTEFLNGKNHRSWKATFDWLMVEENMVKVLEGNYANKEQESGSGYSDEHWEAFFNEAVARPFDESAK